MIISATTLELRYHIARSVCNAGGWLFKAASARYKTGSRSLWSSYTVASVKANKMYGRFHTSLLEVNGNWTFLTYYCEENG